MAQCASQTGGSLASITTSEENTAVNSECADPYLVPGEFNPKNEKKLDFSIKILAEKSWQSRAGPPEPIN